MSEQQRIRSVPIGFGAEGPTWADGLVDLDGLKPSSYPYPWVVFVEWTVEDGRAVVSGMDLRAMHGQPVNATAWRSVPVAQVIEAARRRTQSLHGLLSTFPGGREHHRTVAELAPVPQRKRGRPFAMSDEDYQRAADVYNDAVAAGDPRPRMAVAEAFGCPPGDTRPKAWIRECRRRGLIPESPVGTTKQG